VGQRLFQRLGEFLPGADVGVIEPDGPVAVVIGQRILKPARMSPRIAPAVADEDLRAGQTLFQPGSESDSTNLLSGATRIPAADARHAATPSSASSSFTPFVVGTCPAADKTSFRSSKVATALQCQAARDRSMPKPTLTRGTTVRVTSP
jgi:hypothetical protein